MLFLYLSFYMLFVCMFNKINGKFLMNMIYMYFDFYKVFLNCLIYFNLGNVLFLIIWKMLLKFFIISICLLLLKKIK